MKKSITAWVCALASLTALPAAALDASFSGFATLGHARSDSQHTYQRFIDDDGGFERDSLVAGQLDLRFNPRWSATLQAKLAPAVNKEDRWQPQATWAFVAWRPSDDWLLRAGRMRVPLYLHSESLEVGVSHDMARLPHEMYSIGPTNDFNGLFSTHSASFGEREWTLDLYAGSTHLSARAWSRDGLPPMAPAGARFMDFDVTIGGATLTARDARSTWRLGVAAGRTHPHDGRPFPVRFPRVDLGSGLGYWQVNDALPGPGVPSVGRIRNLVFTGGVEHSFGNGWRATAEFVHTTQRDTEIGSDSIGGYAALFKRMGDFTPYVSVSRQLSGREVREWYRRLTTPTLPPGFPGGDAINAAQRMAGESLYAFDQHSLAIGASYAWSPTAKVKAEWTRTQVGAMSTYFDTPPGRADLRDTHVNTLTLNVSVAF